MTLLRPNRCVNAYFHAQVRDGGLGIPSLRWLMPLHRLQRILHLRLYPSEEGIPNKFLRKELRTVEKRLVDHGGIIPNQEELFSMWAKRLHESVDGGALKESARVPQQHQWIREGTRFLSGKDFVQLTKIRINALPVRSRTARGQAKARECRAGCANKETLNHVLQQCHRTHASRIKRHNAIVSYVVRGLKKKGYQVHEEPRLRQGGELRKPDVVAIKEETALVLDGQVVGEQQNLAAAHQQKIAYYEGLREEVKRKWAVREVRFSSITMNCRGVWGAESVGSLLALGVIRKADIKVLSTRALLGGVIAFRTFNSLTSTTGRFRRGIG